MKEDSGSSLSKPESQFLSDAPQHLTGLLLGSLRSDLAESLGFGNADGILTKTFLLRKERMGGGSHGPINRNLLLRDLFSYLEVYFTATLF